MASFYLKIAAKRGSKKPRTGPFSSLYLTYRSFKSSLGTSMIESTLGCLVTKYFKDIVVSSEPKGIYHRSLHSFRVTVVRGGSEAYAETATGYGVKLNRITKDECICFIKDDQTIYLGDKVKPNLVGHRLFHIKHIQKTLKSPKSLSIKCLFSCTI